MSKKKNRGCESVELGRIFWSTARKCVDIAKKSGLDIDCVEGPGILSR